MSPPLIPPDRSESGPCPDLAVGHASPGSRLSLEGHGLEESHRVLRPASEPRQEAPLTFPRPAERIAVFDNDGTLWPEQPLYFQAAYIFDRIKARYELRDGKPVIVKLPELNFIDDKAGKPVGIHLHIGRRPIAAFGNSDGDFQMLEWTTKGEGSRFGLLVHHDDADREWAYDRDSHIGRLDRGLTEAAQRGWIVVSMKRDWKRIYPPLKTQP